MKKILLALLFIVPIIGFGQEESKLKKEVKKIFKFSTFYGAVNGGNSV